LIVGSMMSRLPFTTSVGCLISLSSPKRSPRGLFHSTRAARCARAVCVELGGRGVTRQRAKTAVGEADTLRLDGLRRSFAMRLKAQTADPL